MGDGAKLKDLDNFYNFGLDTVLQNVTLRFS